MINSIFPVDFVNSEINLQKNFGTLDGDAISSSRDNVTLVWIKEKRESLCAIKKVALASLPIKKDCFPLVPQFKFFYLY